MIDAELRKFIEENIRTQLSIILTAQTETSDGKKETFSNMYPGMSSIADRPVMSPYGVASKVPRGTKSVVAQHGDFKGNRIVLGHRDESRPTEDIEEGEIVIYAKDGVRVRVKNGSIELGKGGTYQKMVMGDNLKTLLVALIEAIVQHKHIGNLGFPTSPPDNASTFQNLKAQNLDNDKILAKEGGGF